MKTINEMCAVMQAFKDGKQIEYRGAKGIEINEWIETDSPIWDWNDLDYRVKPESEYIPYDSVSEIDRSKWVRNKEDPSRLRAITIIDATENEVYIAGYCWDTLEELFKYFEYEDGTPCGKLVEE